MDFSIFGAGMWERSLQEKKQGCRDVSRDLSGATAP